MLESDELKEFVVLQPLSSSKKILWTYSHTKPQIKQKRIINFEDDLTINRQLSLKNFFLNFSHTLPVE